jgi:hypothetical protein
MKNFILNNDIVDLWKDASSPLEYLIALWVTGLAVLAFGGLSVIIVKTIINPHMWDGVQFGLIDYI